MSYIICIPLCHRDEKKPNKVFVLTFSRPYLVRSRLCYSVASVVYL